MRNQYKVLQETYELEVEARATAENTPLKQLHDWALSLPGHEEFATWWSSLEGWEIDPETRMHSNLIGDLVSLSVSDAFKLLTAKNIAAFSSEKEYQKVENAAVKTVKKEIQSRYNNWSAAQNLHKKNTSITGVDTSGLVEARKFSTPEEDNYWEVVIGNYIEKLTTANTFEEFVNAAKTKPATFQQNPSMYYHDKIFIDVINKKFGENNSATKASFIDTMTSVHSTLAYIDLLYGANKDTPMIKREMAEIKKKFNTWLEYRADWYAAKDLHKKNAEITGVDTSGLVETNTSQNKMRNQYKILAEKYDIISEAKNRIKGNDEIKNYIEDVTGNELSYAPDGILFDDPSCIAFSWLKDERGTRICAVEKSNHEGKRFTHNDIEEMIKSEEYRYLNIYPQVPVGEVEPIYAGREGVLRGRLGKIGGLMVLAWWCGYKVMLPYLDKTILYCSKNKRFNLNKLVIATYDFADYYPVIKANTKAPNEVSPEQLKRNELLRRYHGETDPIKKKQIAQQLGLVPQMPNRAKIQVTGDSVINE